MNLQIFFCDSGFSNREPDAIYAEEYQTAKALGLDTAFISYETLVKTGDAAAACRLLLPAQQLRPAIYRGWMLRPAQYQALYELLLSKNYQLINSPAQYRFAHYLPENYPFIEPYTAQSTWIKLDDAKTLDEEKIMSAVAQFGNHPLVLKDYVKSLKHHWEEACFIHSAADRKELMQKVRRFLELQGPDLNEGLVFREFLDLEPLTTHSESGMPLTKEYRLFVKDKKIIQAYPYWDEGEYSPEYIDWTDFQPLIDRLDCRFFSLDIALTKAGSRMVVELGDGQVAGLPDNADKMEFYRCLMA